MSFFLETDLLPTFPILLELASTAADRRLIQSVATWELSGKQAKKTYGIDDTDSKILQLKEAVVVDLPQVHLMRIPGETVLVGDMWFFRRKADEPAAKS